MLPKTQDSPSLGCQVVGRFDIPSHVLGQLGSPPFDARLRLCCVLGTAVPEAAVHDDSDLGLGEGDVDCVTGHPRDWKVHAEAQACCMQKPSDCNLGSSVTEALSAHASGNSAGGRGDLGHSPILPGCLRPMFQQATRAGSATRGASD